MLAGEMRYHKYREHGFATASGKFEIYSSLLEAMGVSPLPVYREPPLTPVSAPELVREYPLILTTGAKIREFFHSEGRQIGSLRKKHPDPLVEIHPHTAASLGIDEGDWVLIETPHDRVRMRARLFDGIAPDVVSAEHAWWFPEDDAPEYGWRKSNVNLLFGEMEYDPDSGSESLRSALCKVYKVEDR
jgi:anaerobic selenocysteine-containing dehydrogenase